MGYPLIDYDSPMALTNSVNNTDGIAVTLLRKSWNPFNRFAWTCLVHAPGQTHVEFFDKKGFKKSWIHGPSLKNVRTQTHWEIVRHDGSTGETFYDKDMAMKFAAGAFDSAGNPKPYGVREVVVGAKNKVISVKDL